MSDHHDAIFKALADPSRRRIMAALCKESMVAGDLGRLVSLAPNAVSFHLRLLQEARLVSVRREGRFLWYEAQRQVIDDWRSFAHELLGTEPGTIEDHVSRPPAYAPPAGLARAAPISDPVPIERSDAVSPDSSTETLAEEPDDKLPDELL